MQAGHTRFMQVALRLAARHLGQTWPNPSVGAVLAKDGQMIAIGITAKGGRPHAETQALQLAGARARGATLYVTLEPCAHTGHTPPCTQAIIEAGITRCIVACRDPNPQVNGQGIAQLKAAGIEVTESICEAEAMALNAGFFSVVQKQRPFISVKLATSLDGKIATASGDSQWITGEAARCFGHGLRSRYDAIATGIGTVLADDPLLTCRLPGLEDRSPVRVVFDRQGRLPEHSQLAKTAKDVPVWALSKNTVLPLQGGGLGGGLLQQSTAEYVTKDPHPASPLQGEEKTGCRDLPHAMRLLAERGITRLLVEAGATLSTAFLRSGLVDRIYWFRAPMIIGGDGLAAVGGGFSDNLAALPRHRVIETLTFSPDTLDIIACSPAS